MEHFLTICQSGFAPKTGIFRWNLHYFSDKAFELKIVILNIFTWSFSHTKQKNIHKKFAILAARAVIVSTISRLSDSKTITFAEQEN
jgi:hypothetical protein